MSQVLEDLPDPLDPPPLLPAASTDDLLAKMADDAIDQLLASADKSGSVSVPPVAPLPVTPPPETPSAVAADSVQAVVSVESVLAEAAPAAPAESAAPSTGLDEFSLASAIDDVLPFTDVEESPPVVVPPPGPAPAADAADVQITASAVATAATEAVSAQSADVKALLKEDTEAQKTSLLLLPLQILNAPFAWIGDKGRTFAGLLGIVTLVPAACAIVYVVFLRK